MKYSIIFAAAVAASDSYGPGGYGDEKSTSIVMSSSKEFPAQPSSSTVVYPASSTTVYDHAYGHNEASSSSAKASTSAKTTVSSMEYSSYGEKAHSTILGYGMATIAPGYGRPPVTITAPYQPYQTCGVKNANGQDCDTWNDNVYVSTVVKDCDGNDQTITKTDQSVMIYHTKATTTHYSTITKSASASKTSNSYPAQETEVKPWYAAYEEIHEAQYKDLGKHALTGYPGSGLRDDLDSKQPFHVKKYEDGKWSEYDSVKSYGIPSVETSTFQAPGVYTIPGKDIYVDTPMTRPAEATVTAKAGVPVTFGGVYSSVEKPCTITGAVGAYETGVQGGQTVTSTIVKYVTVYCPTAGNCEIQKPSTTTYDHDTEVAYPTPTVYMPGVYHQTPSVVTITKSGQAVTCGQYKQTSTYPVDVPSHTPVHGVPSKLSQSVDHDHGYKSSSTKPAVATPSKHAAAASSKPVHGDHGYGHNVASTPDAEKSSSVPTHPAYPASASAPSYSGTVGHSHHAHPASSTSDHYPEATGSHDESGSGDSDSDNEEDDYESGNYGTMKPTSTPAYPEHSASASALSYSGATGPAHHAYAASSTTEQRPEATDSYNGDDNNKNDTESGDKDEDFKSNDESSDFKSDDEVDDSKADNQGNGYESASGNVTSSDDQEYNQTSQDGQTIQDGEFESSSHNETSHDNEIEHDSEYQSGDRNKTTQDDQTSHEGEYDASATPSASQKIPEATPTGYDSYETSSSVIEYSADLTPSTTATPYADNAYGGNAYARARRAL